MNAYATIGAFGSSPDTQTNPMTYCFVSGLDSGTYHNLGGQNLSGPGNRQCQIFTAAYCAQKWDGVCEFASNDNQKGPMVVNMVRPCNGLLDPLTRGEILIRNTAAEKYLKAMSPNCKRDYEPFDPSTAGSPLISSWYPKNNSCGNAANCNGPNVCIPVYGVDPTQIDNDPVMNKILAKPSIAMDVLVNIYNNARYNGQLEGLQGTKLYNYFKSPQFQSVVASNVYRV